MYTSLKTFLNTTAILVWLTFPQAISAATANVTVNNSPTGFVPATTNIHAGDAVVWTWPSGSNQHNVTSSSTPAAWTASATHNGPATFTNTFNSSGTFAYRCTVHGFTGKIVVLTNLPPVIVITSPPPGRVFATPATITIQATVSDPNSGGSVTNVEFRVDANLLTRQTTPPFSATTNNVGSGSHTLSAIAMNNLGLRATNSVNIVVDVPPNIGITNPALGTVLAEPANVTIQASVTDADGTVTNVQFLIGAIVLANKTASPFFTTISNQPAGNYLLSAVATDNAGLTATNSVALSIVTPVPLTLSNATLLSSTNFHFTYSANIGLSYVVQKSTDLLSSNWISIFTNTATSNPATFTDTNAVANPAFYRVIRLPNP